MGGLILPKTSSLAESAQAYALLGWPVLPLYEPLGDGCSCGKSGCSSPGKHPRMLHGVKQATSDSNLVAQSWEKWPTANVGIATGVAIDVLDVDGPEGERSLDELMASNSPLADGPVAITGKGRHLLLQPTGARNRVGISPGLDWRAAGGYVVAPPSRHANGRVYEWEDGHAQEVPAAPDWLSRLVKASDRRPPRTGSVPSGQRNATLASVGGRLRRAGIDPQTILLALRSENEARCTPPLLDAEVVTIWKSICRYDVPARVFNRTDAGQAEFLAAVVGETTRFDHKLGRWLLWNGALWASDSDGSVTRMALAAARMRQEAAVAKDDETRSSEVGFGLLMEAKPKLAAVVEVAKALPPIADDGGGWDASPDLIGVANGVVDLRAGDRRDAQPGDRITMSAAVSYVSAASCPRWLRYLDEVCGGDSDLIEFLHRTIGYTLTGDCQEEVFFLLYGPGSNGKTVLMKTIATIMGQYATTIPFAALESSQSGRIPNDIAALARKRLVMSSETSASTRFNEALLKSLTGRDPIAARFLYHETFVFQPDLKLWLAVNHLPVVTDQSRGLWRRVLVIPFNVTFDGPAVEKDLQHQLDREGPGILAWAVEGARRWYEQGWTVPVVVAAATEGYRLENDTVGRFLSEESVTGPEVSARAGEMFGEYEAWAKREGLSRAAILSGTAFGIDMKARFQWIKKSFGVVYFRVGLRSRLQADVDA